MNINDKTITFSIPQHEYKQPSQASKHAAGFVQERNIERIHEQNIVNNIYEVFDKSLSDLEIKQLISARLQPEHILPQVHNTDALLSKADKLLDFSIAI